MFQRSISIEKVHNRNYSFRLNEIVFLVGLRALQFYILNLRSPNISLLVVAVAVSFSGNQTSATLSL